MGAHFEALDEGVLMAPLDPRYTQVGFKYISVQVWDLTAKKNILICLKPGKRTLEHEKALQIVNSIFLSFTVHT